MKQRSGCAPGSSFDLHQAHGAPLSYTDVVACLAVLGLAAFIQGVFGLGFAMIATPLLALFVDYPSAVLTAAVPLFVLAAIWLVSKRRSLRASGVPWLVLPGIVGGAVVGVGLQAALPVQVSLLLLSGLLVFSVVVPRLVAQSYALTGVRARGATALLGGLAGATETALNVGAPFMVLLAGMCRFSRLQMVLVLNLCFFMGKAIQLTLVFALGTVRPHWPLLAGGVLVSGSPRFQCNK